MDILCTEGAWFSHIISLCNPIYPVINEHITKISILDRAKNSKKNRQRNAIHPLPIEEGDFLLNLVKITQKSVAEHLGVTLRTYQRYEEGTIDPPLITVLSIAEYFDVSTDCLLGNGIFSNWEEIIIHKDIILKALTKEIPYPLEKWDLNSLSERQLARILPSILTKVVFDESNNISISLFIPQSEWSAKVLLIEREST